MRGFNVQRARVWLCAAAVALTGASSAPSFHLSYDGLPWRAAVTHTPVGKGYGRTFSQWSIAVYHGDTLAYESPRDGGPLSKVVKATGADMWFPSQSASIVGAGAFMGGTSQQLVVESHETGADCGSATITIFRYDETKKTVVPAVTVQNACDLSATIHGSAIVLSGPYYTPKAALCCPTKPQAHATLTFTNNTWQERPHLYTLYPNAFPHV